MMDAFPKAKIHPSGNLGSMFYKSVSASAKKKPAGVPQRLD